MSALPPLMLNIIELVEQRIFRLNSILASSKVYRGYLKRKFHWYDRESPSLQVRRFSPYLKNNTLILEVGCGSGIDARYLRKAGHSVITTDVIAGVADKVCGVEELPFGDGLFEGLFCRGVFHLVDCRKALDEINRTVKPGAVVHISYPQDIYDEKYYQIVPELNIKQRYCEIFHYSRKLNNHGDHSHHFVEVLGKWKK